MDTRMPPNLSIQIVIQDWNNFFIGTAGAGGALVGLIIVAMSVNIRTILTIPGMTSRAAATIAAMTVNVLVSLAGLIPRQSDRVLGVEILIFALLATVLAVDSAIQMIRNPPPGWIGGAWLRGVFAVGQLMPITLGGILLLAAADSGIYWVSAGILTVFVASVANSWVLLVEVLR